MRGCSPRRVMTTLAERLIYADTQLFDERDVWCTQQFLDVVSIGEAERTAGIAYTVTAAFGYPQPAPKVFFQGRVGSGWMNIGEQQARVIFLKQPTDLAEISPLDDLDVTYSLSAPMFEAPVGTGEL